MHDMPLTAAQADSSKRTSVNPFAYPLDEFYAHAGRSLPCLKTIEGESMPEPQRSLLVHTSDMTPTLQQFYGDTIHLQVLNRYERGDFYFREVVLLLDGSGKPVEYGAIKISLALFPPNARREILEGRLPLGHILHKEKIRHSSRPKAYLQMEPDEFMKAALQLKNGERLFGRRNTLTDPAQRALAEIVEVLPPA